MTERLANTDGEVMSTTENSLLNDESNMPFDPTLLTPSLGTIMAVAPTPLSEPVHTCLSEAGYELVQIKQLELVLEQAKALKLEMILFEVGANDTDLFKTCQLLKNDTQTEDIPVIFITRNKNYIPDLACCLGYGANDFIFLDENRPDCLTELEARIQSTLRDKLILGKSKALASQLNDDYSVLYKRNLQVEKELYITRQLQQSLLPKVIPNTHPVVEGDETPQIAKHHYRDEKIRISGIYIPCDALGGDLYDVIRFNNDTIGITVADVSGHGVPAAFITAIFKAAFYRMTNTYEKPGDILFHLNNELYHIIKTGEYVTCIYCRIKENGTRLEYTGAGHPYPIHYNPKTKQLQRLKENGTPLVWLKDMEYPMGEVELSPGDKVLIFTDGISEINNQAREMFGEPALEALFEKLVHEHPHNILDKMIEALSEFTQGHPLEDDMSIVLIEVLE